MRYFIFQPVSFEPRYICARPWAGPWGKTVNGADTVQPFWNLLSCLVYRQIGVCEKGCDSQSIDVIEVHMRKAEFSLRQLGEAFLKQRTREDGLPPTEWVINRSWPEEGDSATWESVPNGRNSGSGPQEGQNKDRMAWNTWQNYLKE